MFLLVVSLGWAPRMSTVKGEKGCCSEDAPEQHLQWHAEILLPHGGCKYPQILHGFRFRLLGQPPPGQGATSADVCVL